MARVQAVLAAVVVAYAWMLKEAKQSWQLTSRMGVVCA